MQPQGFHSCEVSDAGIAPPSGYGVARATLGGFSETVFFDTFAWTFQDYERHWKWSARALLSGEDLVIFCTAYLSPILPMRPCRSLPPLEFCCGISPAASVAALSDANHPSSQMC